VANYTIRDDHHRQYFLSSQSKQPDVPENCQHYDNSDKFDIGLKKLRRLLRNLEMRGYANSSSKFQFRLDVDTSI